MKIFVITKKTLLMALCGVLIVIAAIVFALVSGKKQPAADGDTVGTYGNLSGNANGGMVGENMSNGNTSGNPSGNPDDSEGNVGTSGNVVEEYELEVLSGLMKELPVYSVSREDKTIALTIDAAWEDDKTDFILQTLAKYDVKATFFLCGFWAKDYPDKVKAIYEAGHEIGNHSMTHPHMSKLTAGQIADELKQYDDLLESIIGVRSKLFRAPYGEYDDHVINAVHEAGYEAIQWDIDTIDWRKERSAEKILDTVLSKLDDGSIILCHNNGYTIEQYLPTLIETALDQGYRFVTVSELLLPGETIVDVNGVQKPAQ